MNGKHDHIIKVTLKIFLGTKFITKYLKLFVTLNI